MLEVHDELAGCSSQACCTSMFRYDCYDSDVCCLTMYMHVAKKLIERV